MTTDARAGGELGAFLRARRERLSPEEVGLPVHDNRRTQGLRREEVAVLAGVSVDYYTRLEQGRDEHPSRSIVTALASALRLTEQERAHLFLLADLAEPRQYRVGDDAVRRSVASLLDTLMPAPAYVVTPIGDFVTWNAATSVLWIDPATLEPHERNLARMILLDPRMRDLWLDWECIARETVAHLRASTVKFPTDARLTTLVGELLVQSPEFAGWWSEHDVATRCSPRKRFAHPTEGELAFVNESMELVGDGLLFMVYVPADEATRAVCARLSATAAEDPDAAPVTRETATGGTLRAVGAD